MTDPGELEEVVIEPDLPVDEPEESEEDPDVAAGLERLIGVGIADPRLDDSRRDYLRLVGAMPSSEPVYVAGNRAPRLKVGTYTLQPGEIVPGAHSWLRREAYERLGRIERR